MDYHFWDYTEAKTASVATVRAKVRKGWKLYAVSQGFGAAGGVANYAHALRGPAGELLKLSTRTFSSAGVAVEPEVLPLSMLVVLLTGVFKSDLTLLAIQKGLDRAEDFGVRWNAERRTWMVRPEDATELPRWMTPSLCLVPMFPSLVG